MTRCLGLVCAADRLPRRGATGYGLVPILDAERRIARGAPPLSATGDTECQMRRRTRRCFIERHLFFCNNSGPEGHPRGSCSARAAELGGVEKLRGYAREKARQLGIENIRCNGAGCLDRCEFGPNMVIYPEGVWYRYENTADIDEILETHVKNGGRVERLMLTPDQLPREALSPRSARLLRCARNDT